MFIYLLHKYKQKNSVTEFIEHPVNKETNKKILVQVCQKNKEI